MDNTINEIAINGTIYIPKTASNKEAEQLDGLDYVIIRAQSAGVFAGYLEEQEDDTVILRNARRLWYWDGAASLSQLAVDGVSAPQNCKFPCEVAKIKILKVIEILFASEKSRLSIAGVAVWKK